MGYEIDDPVDVCVLFLNVDIWKVTNCYTPKNIYIFSHPTYP